MRKYILFIIVSALFYSSYGSNVIALPYSTTDIVYSKIHGKLYALIDAMEPEYGNRLIEINITTGAVERNLFVGSQPFLIKLSSDENYAWISFEGIPFVKRIDLNTFEIVKEIYLGPSKQHYEPNHRQSTVFAYNFAIFPNDNNTIALGLKTPFLFDFEALSLYRNDTMLPIKLVDSNLINGYYPFCFEPVLNGDFLIGHWQSSSESVYSTIKVHDNGLEFLKEDITLNQMTPLSSNWFKVHNDTLYTAVGEIIGATDTSDLKELGIIENNIMGFTYGYTFSDIHNSFVYPNIHNNSLYLTFYNKNTFKAFDSAYLFEYPFYQYIFIQEIEVIDKNRFAILMGKDGEYFTTYIIETNTSGIEPIQTNNNPEIFPNPATHSIFINGYPDNKKIRVYDITGNLIETIEHSGISAEIDMSNYQPGLYLIKISDIEGKYNSVVKKIVLQ